MDNIYLCVGFLFLVHCVVGQNESDLRLHNGHHPYHGYLQVYHKGSWGSVCNASWTENNAKVACKELGFLGAALPTSPIHFPDLEGKIHLTEVQCTGKEQRIVDCQHQMLTDESECDHEGDVRLECLAPGYEACVATESKEPPFRGKRKILQGLTKAHCINTCRTDGFVYASMGYYNQCSCGSEPERVPLSSHRPYEDCSELTCSGDEYDMCGREDRALVYRVDTGSCGGIISASEGTVTSPGFPHRYVAGMTCVWNIKTDNPWTRVSVPFLTISEGDEIEVSFGKKSTPSIVRYDSDSTERTFPSTESNMITVTFKSVALDGGKGFILSFRDDTQCAIPVVKNGSLSNKEGMIYREGDKLKLECNKTYAPSNNTVKCTKRGEWFPTPKCEKPRGVSMNFIRTILIMAIVGLIALGILFGLTACMFGCIGANEKRSSGYQGITTEIVEAPQSDSIQEERYTPLKDEVKIQLDSPEEEQGEMDNTVNEQQQEQPMLEAKEEELDETPLAAEEEGSPGDETIEADETMA